MSRRALLLSSVLLAGCSNVRDVDPRVDLLYARAALVEARNPVVVIHGILGARLEQRSTGKTVWGALTADGIDPQSPTGARALALPLVPRARASDYDPEGDDVRATGPLEELDLSLLFATVSVQIYANIIRALGAGGYSDRVVTDPTSPRYAEDHFTCYSFFYDWRQDNVANAIRLKRFLDATRGEIDQGARRRIARLQDLGTPQAREEAAALQDWLSGGYRFDLVAHSMGGLIARWFLRYGDADLPEDGSLPEVTWAGAPDVDRVVLVGTPNFGAIESFERLLQGYSPSFLLPYFEPVLLGTMPALYQLLPRVRHGVLLGPDGTVASSPDLFDAKVWERNGWGLMAPDAGRVLAVLQPEATSAERQAQAKAYLTWCLDRARRFHAALDSAPARPCPSRLVLFAADALQTPARVRLQEVDGRLRPVFGTAGTHDFGDGTVPRYSALGDEREGRPYQPWLRSPIPWSQVTFLADDHIGLTKNPQFGNNLLFLLLETMPR